MRKKKEKPLGKTSYQVEDKPIDGPAPLLGVYPRETKILCPQKVYKKFPTVQR
jgi:hypothetical protein